MLPGEDKFEDRNGAQNQTLFVDLERFLLSTANYHRNVRKLQTLENDIMIGVRDVCVFAELEHVQHTDQIDHKLLTTVDTSNHGNSYRSSY